MSRRLKMLVAPPVAAFALLVACEHGKGGPLDGQGPGGDAPGSGLQCGGFAGTQCPDDEFCDFPTNNCGGTDETGACRRRPTSCDTLAAPVCGCDGTVHGNACSANAAGFDVNAFGTCKVDPGEFTCGFAVCTIAFEFCSHQVSDEGGFPDDFACVPLPASCEANASCACLAGELCGENCTGDAASGLKVTCPGG